jgi:hypothetical protein
MASFMVASAQRTIEVATDSIWSLAWIARLFTS